MAATGKYSRNQFRGQNERIRKEEDFQEKEARAGRSPTSGAFSGTAAQDVARETLTPAQIAQNKSLAGSPLSPAEHQASAGFGEVAKARDKQTQLLEQQTAAVKAMETAAPEEKSKWKQVLDLINQELVGAGKLLTHPSEVPAGIAQDFPGAGLASVIGTGGISLGTTAIGEAGSASVASIKDAAKLSKQAIARAKRAALRGKIIETTRRYGKDPTKLLEKLDVTLMNAEIKAFQTKGIGFMTGKLSKGLFKTGVALAGVDTMVSWAALDNGIGGQKIFSNQLVKGVEEGEIDPIEARKELEEAMVTRDQLIASLRTSMTINPLLWASGQMMLTVAEADAVILDRNMEKLNGYAGTQEVTGETPLTFQEETAAAAEIKQGQFEENTATIAANKNPTAEEKKQAGTAALHKELFT